MKKEDVLRDYYDMCNGTFKCIERRRCSGCKKLASLSSQQLFGVPPTTPASQLKPVHLKNIVQDLYRRARNNQKLLQDNKLLLHRWYEQRLLLGSLCVDATRRGISVLTVVEADDGTTCILHVFNAMQPSSRQEELRKMFPKGIKVVITRPSIGCLHPSVTPVVLYVQSPGNLDFVGVATSPPEKLVAMPPQELRKEGNALFAQGSYLVAIQYYSDCVAASLGRKDGGEEMKLEAVLAISNRAEAWLKLGMYEKAIADSNRAIGMDAFHAKSFYRKGRALMAIQEHVEARVSLKSAAKYSSDGDAKKEILEALAKCKVFLQQSQKGVYDVGDYVSSGCNAEHAPKCSDYVGPVEVRLTRDGRGRGLFVTKKVRLGELLLVSNNISFASCVKEEAGAAESELLVGALKACRSSQKIIHQLYAIDDAASVPSMKIFRPNLGYEGAMPPEEAPPLDVARIQGAVKAAYFPWTMLGQSECSKSRVWGLPAFVNHSCLPNVSKLEVGKATMFHAARDLHAGDELLISYVDPYAPWSTERRKALVEDWGFECHCRRCCLERSNKELLRDLLPLDDSLKYDSIEKCTQLLASVEERLGRVAGMSKDDKDLIRVTLFDFYGPLSVSGKKSADASGGHEALKLITPDRLFRLLHSTAPGHPKTLVFMSYLARFRESPSDVCHFLMDEFTAAYGSQCACLAWKVLQSYFEAALENFMEVGGLVEYRVCKCWFAEDKGFRVECLM
ncbi:hypothetical protein SELMODRAFT_447985 [Selaginella moellendorffii]|uniref:SET domain-containing protein n=1 Tax=Selaginella moellendorffii TaxID=88036 RepID=D8T3Y4_SELML|nr:hypothetical protein SELMODRAFT_447985 [Selaginella moellendorffii]